MKEKKLDFLDKWYEAKEDFYKKILPILLVFGFIVLVPITYYNIFKNAYYCSKDKDRFEFIIKERIDNKIVTSIYKGDVTSIYCKDGILTYMLITCAKFSKNDPKLSINSIKIGDTIFKETNMNEFYLIRNGNKVAFEIDTKRNLDGTKK